MNSTKIAPMKRTKQNNLSKKGQHTFTNHLKLSETVNTRKSSRKSKQAQRWEAWTA